MTAHSSRLKTQDLLRYQLRPPLSKARLTRLDDGRVKLRLRTPYSDGTTHLIFTPHELLERLAALVPRPQKNLIIYHGCLAPRAKDRDKVVAFGRTGSADRHTAPDLPLLDIEMVDEDSERTPSRHHTWAELMERVWGSQVLRCPRCNAPLRLIALVTAPFAIKAILDHIGLNTGPRTLSRPPVKGQLDLFEPEDLRPCGRARGPCRSPPTHQWPELDATVTG